MKFKITKIENYDGWNKYSLIFNKDGEEVVQDTSGGVPEINSVPVLLRMFASMCDAAFEKKGECRGGIAEGSTKYDDVTILSEDWIEV